MDKTENQQVIFETERLRVRALTQADFDNLCTILQDAEAMYAYEHAFSDQEVQEWLERQLQRYEKDGMGLWAVHLKADGTFIGQAGLTMQQCDGEELPEIGYLFRRDYWHQGYAAEFAVACRDYAFDVLDIPVVYSIIRDSNLPSKKVAEKNSMHVVKRVTKYYYNMEMPHDVYAVSRQALRQKTKQEAKQE